MMRIFYMLLTTLCLSCNSVSTQTVDSNRLVSSKGEVVFVNSINKGVTGDYQLSILTKDSLKLKDRNDTIGAIEGLNPFFYRFKNDTLTLFFYQNVSYRIQEKFSTIAVVYKIINSKDWLEVANKVDEGGEYFSVPMRKKVEYPSDMPPPPEK